MEVGPVVFALQTPLVLMISRGASEKDYILGLSTFHFPQKDENSSEMESREYVLDKTEQAEKGLPCGKT